MDSHNFDFDILRKKAKCKRKLTQKLVYWHHIDANPSVIDTIEILQILQRTAKIFHFFACYSRFNNFVLCFPIIFVHQSAVQNEYFVTHTVKKNFKIWQNQGNQNLFLHHKSFNCRQKQLQKTKIHLGFVRNAIFLVYKVRIKFDHWRTIKDFVYNNFFSL